MHQLAIGEDLPPELSRNPCVLPSETLKLKIMSSSCSTAETHARSRQKSGQECSWHHDSNGRDVRVFLVICLLGVCALSLSLSLDTNSPNGKQLYSTAHGSKLVKN